jgi:photosystem II stability/assembly factor-like uncharacterized protein
LRAPARLVLAALLAAGPAAAAPYWQALPGAPVAQRLDDLHFLDVQHGWVCTGDGGIFRTSDGGATWEQVLNNPARYYRCIRFADPQRGFAGTLTSGAVLERTTDGGDTWSTVSLPDPRPNALCGLSIASSQVIYGVGSYAGPARVIKSVDGGATWTSQDLAPLASTAIDVFFRSATEGFVVGSVGSFPSANRSVVLHTTDGGATWQQRFEGTRLGEWCWKISFPTALVGYISLERFAGPMYFLKTVDGGLTWTELPFPDYNEQGVGFATPDVGWIGGADNPTLGTTDGGATWTPTPWGEYLNRFQFLSPTLGYGTGVTVYRYAEAPLAVGDERPRPRPAVVAPNPFGLGTTIRFTLQRPERVQLLIADPSGRIVRTLGDAERGAGPHVVEWDGRTDRGTRAPAGIYLYILHAGERHEMGKLVRVP